MKLQSAFEYLTTYGWAIFAIVIVLVVLYSLGVFNPNTFSPKAQPGACYIYRPYGPNTTSFIALQGTCTNNIPEFVGRFNGHYSMVVAPYQGLSSMKNFTVTMWFYPIGVPCCSAENSLYSYGALGSGGEYITLAGSSPVGLTANIKSSELFSTSSFNTNTWYFIAHTVSYNAISGNSVQSLYVNGVNQTSGSFAGNAVLSNTGVVIGMEGTCCWAWPFNGLISNVQVYNSSITPSGVSALYIEGIGGAPINVETLMAWWPLNGNGNDYSGNGNNATDYNVTFSSSWYNTYGVP